MGFTLNPIEAKKKEILGKVDALKAKLKHVDADHNGKADLDEIEADTKALAEKAAPLGAKLEKIDLSAVLVDLRNKSFLEAGKDLVAALDKQLDGPDMVIAYECFQKIIEIETRFAAFAAEAAKIIGTDVQHLV